MSGPRIAVNAWFLDQPGTGSGQYLRGLLRAWPVAGAGHRLVLVTPPGRVELDLSGLETDFWSVPGRLWRSNVGRVLFEQVAFAWVCCRSRADVAHVPCWGSPLRPTVPTVVTVHDPLTFGILKGRSQFQTYMVEEGTDESRLARGAVE